MVLPPYYVRGERTFSNDSSSEDSTLIIDWNDPPMPSDNEEDIDENMKPSKNDDIEEASTPIQGQNDKLAKPDDDTVNDIAQAFDLLKIGTAEKTTTPIQDQNGMHVKSKDHTNKDVAGDTDLLEKDCMKEKIEEHTKAIKHLKEKSKNIKARQKDFAEHMEASFKLLRARVTNVHDVLKRETELVGQMAAREYHENKANIEALHDRQNRVQDDLDFYNDNMSFWLQHNDTATLRNLLDRQNANLEAAMKSLQNKDLTSEETSKLYDSFLRMLHEDGNEIRAVYTKELLKQLEQCAYITKKQTWRQASYHAEVEDVKATLEEYAKENESLKDTIAEQESKITALMDDNWTFKLQIRSLLYTVRLLEAKVDRLSTEVQDLATL